ncbi:MAG: hypothetical protein IJB31_07845 [Akkermansia sp.]|nr:hypothetical protein [Akkermansia sp.]
MDKIELLKKVMDRTPLGQAPFLTKLEAKLSLSSLKSDPIDRECSMTCDVIDSICEMVIGYVQSHANFFENPDCCCDSFRRAMAADKLANHLLAQEMRKMREHENVSHHRAT